MRVWPTSSALLAIALATLTLAAPAGATSPTLPLNAAAGSALAGEAGAGAEPETRIVGGAPAESARYPWQVELGINLKGGESFLCGGSLIHPYIVITAAHCLVNEFGRFERLQSVEVWLGRTLLSSGGELEFARSAWKPPLYDPVDNVPAANRFDFAFLVLPLAALQQRILIAGADERALWTPGRIATVTGWGTTSEGGSLSPVLKEAQVPVVADGTCAEPIVYGAEFDPETMVCAGYPGGGTDSCQGDSGGPLESPIDGGGYRLTGIVSWGDGCARPGKPGVYTRIAGDLENTVIEMVAVIEREEGLPVLDVIGHGARPPGCGDAEAALAEASAELAAAQQAVAHRRQALRSAKRKLAAARRARRRAQRTGRRLGIVLRRLEVARLRVKLRRHGLSVARRGVATAAATVVTATGDRSAVCG